MSELSEEEIATLILSLKYSQHKVITSAEDRGHLVELLAVQMTRESLNAAIEGLSCLLAQRRTKQ